MILFHKAKDPVVQGPGSEWVQLRQLLAGPVVPILFELPGTWNGGVKMRKLFPGEPVPEGRCQTEKEASVSDCERVLNIVPTAQSREVAMRMRSRLNPEEQSNLVEGPTTYRKGPNKFALVCDLCGGSFYVDEVMFHQAHTAMEEGSDNPFCCEECVGEYEEMAH